MISETTLDYNIAYIYNTLIPNSGYTNFLRLFQRIYGHIGCVFYIGNYLFEFGGKKENLKGYNFQKVISSEVFNSIVTYYNGIVRYINLESVVFTSYFIYFSDGHIICEHNDALQVQKELLKFIPKETNEAKIKYVYTIDSYIDVHTLPVDDYNTDLSINYNDDIPTDKLTKVLRENRSSISILHGIPGTGKTTYLRKLISDNKDLSFYWLDAKLLNLITTEKFFSFFINNKNAIYIIEDCEDLLVDRSEQNNNLLPSLLNLSDGLLGDSLNVKFICTFNADINKIDPAILRKGRLKVKYEFKELCSEKVKILADKLGINIPEIKPMPLCEIYNYEQDNGVKPKITRKVGF